MSPGAPTYPTSGDVGNGEDGHGIVKSFKALEISHASLFKLGPPPSPPPEAQVLGDHAHDSGYGSVSSTPDNNKRTPILSRKPESTPFIRQLGFYVSTVPMKAETKQRFLEVQLEVERLLLEFMRSLKPAPVKRKPIAIRPMMLSKTDVDSNAEPYMVVICPDTIKRKIGGFLDDPLVKSLCRPDEGDIPSFKVLVIGHALKLRASTSDITVECQPINGFHEGEETFCGIPIRLSDKFGHSRNATFGGIVKVNYTDTDYHLYGLTAGHMIRDYQVVMDEGDTDLFTLNDSDPLQLDSDKPEVNTSDEDICAASPASDNGIDKVYHKGGWRFYDSHNIGQMIDAGWQEARLDEEQGQTEPYLDWAIFELNAYRPNRITFHTGEFSRGDLHLPLRGREHVEDELLVSMICPPHQFKRGVLSTSCTRILLEPGDNFTDAYTLLLEDSEVRDGDSGSWVVDVLGCEVYGHVVADDVFGIAYVIPMHDILTDIKRSLGATSVDLPTGLDVLSIATQRQPSLISQALFMERNKRTRAVEDLANSRVEVASPPSVEWNPVEPLRRSKMEKDSGYISWAGSSD